MTDDDDDRGFRFTLPPIRLPRLFPPALRLRFPAAERVRGSRNRLLAAIALDLLDAAVALTVGAGAVRVAVGALLALLIVGPVGLVYAWEIAAVVSGVSWLAVAPSATLLTLARRVR